MSHRLPEHCPRLALHFRRNRQDHTGVLHISRYRYVLPST